MSQKRRRSSVKSTSTSPRKTPTDAVAAKPPTGAKLTTEEGVEKGRVKREVMVTYMRSVGWFFTTLTLLMFLAQNGFMFFSSVWLKDWADGTLPKGVPLKSGNDSIGLENNNASTSSSEIDSASGNSTSSTTSNAFSSEVYLGVYALLGVAQGITILLCKCIPDY